MMRMREAMVLIATLGLTGCYYDNEEELYPGTFCDTANVTWSGTIEPIIQTRCAIPGCHVPGGTGTGDLLTYADVKEIADNGLLRLTVLVDQSMPQTGPLGDCEQQQINIWLNDGAPEN